MSMMNTEAGLPIGSVVMLEGIPKLICVIGRDIKNGVTGENFEYGGVVYPVGYTEPDQCYMFNENNIDKVYSFGLLEDFDEREPGVSNASCFEGVLPVGSVVRLRGASRCLMIAGVAMDASDGNSYDYGAVLFPHGFENGDNIYVFNRENIEEIVHVGFIYDGQLEYEKNVQEMLSK